MLAPLYTPLYFLRKGKCSKEKERRGTLIKKKACERDGKTAEGGHNVNIQSFYAP